MDDDRLDYLVVDRDEFTNDRFYTSEGMANSSYNSSIKDVEWRKERGYKPSSDYSEEWTDCLSVYEYNEIEYTVNYISNGDLDVYVRNPYTEVYDLRYAVNAGKDNPDYLKFAEDFIDRIEFID